MCYQQAEFIEKENILNEYFFVYFINFVNISKDIFQIML